MNAFTQNPSDGGTMYTETNLHQLFPEPLNAITSCFFLAIAVYFTLKLRGNFKQHAFLSLVLALLYTGGIGGTIYHGFRRWPIFIMMDWMPIMLLCLSAGGLFFGQNNEMVFRCYYCFYLCNVSVFLTKTIYGRRFSNIH